MPSRQIVTLLWASSPVWNEALFVLDLDAGGYVSQLRTLVDYFPQSPDGIYIMPDTGNIWIQHTDAAESFVEFDRSGNVISSFSAGAGSFYDITHDGTNFYGLEPPNKIYRVNGDGTSDQIWQYDDSLGSRSYVGLTYLNGQMWLGGRQYLSRADLTTVGTVVEEYEYPGHWLQKMSNDDEDIWVEDGDTGVFRQIFMSDMSLGSDVYPIPNGYYSSEGFDVEGGEGGGGPPTGLRVNQRGDVYGPSSG